MVYISESEETQNSEYDENGPIDKSDHGIPVTLSISVFRWKIENIGVNPTIERVNREID